MNKKILSLLIALVMILGSFTTALAADFDLIHKTDPSMNTDMLEFMDDLDIYDQVTGDFANYEIEYNGKFYSLQDVQDELNAGAATLKEAIQNLEADEPAEPPVAGTYEIRLTADDLSLVGDGKTNTTIHVELVDNVTRQREHINGLQVRLTTTKGQLSDQQVVLQNGYAHTTLNSEAVQRAEDVDLDAQVIEGTVPLAYKDNITGMSAKLGLIFKTPSGEKLEDIPRLLKAESNQADRVTLFFDRNVDPKDFKDLTKSIAKVSQAAPIGNRKVVGFHRLAGNDPHTLEVILAKNKVLTDNKNVEVSLTLNRGTHSLSMGPVKFILTDNRKPQVTEVEHNGNMRQIAVYFSEAIESAQFSLDGGTNPIKSVDYGDYNPSTQTDNRHIVTLNVEYLEPGEHTLQVSAPKDFAYATDTENIGTTQELKFTVLDNDVKPTATVEVESPEQYRIKLNNATKLTGSLQRIQLQTDASGVWKEIKLKDIDGNDLLPPYPEMSGENYQGFLDDYKGLKLAWVTQYGNFKELVVETNTDWTWVFDTENTEDNYYNHNFRLVIPAGMFTNLDNNESNDEIILPLDLELDDDSPVLMKTPVERDLDIGQHDLLFNEPVKGVDIEEDEVGETPSQRQHEQESSALPNIVVEYRGKDANGVTVTKYGYAEGYVSTKGEDTEIRVRSYDNLRSLVDYECYEEEWVMIVRNVTDDIGNAAHTITKPFTIKATPAPARVFRIAEAEIVITQIVDGEDVNLPTNVDEATVNDDYDIVRVEYTDFIRLTGNDDSAINKSNYKLNGRDLGTDSFVLVDLDSYMSGNYADIDYEGEEDEDEECVGFCRYDYAGYNAVYIFTPKGSILNTQLDNSDSNTLEVNQRLYSKNFTWSSGVKLIDEYQVELDYLWDADWNFPICEDRA